MDKEVEAATIRTKHTEYINQIRDLEKQIEHVRVNMKHLQLDCKHQAKYSTNTWGRDPGGAYCPDCGKNW